VQGAGVRQPRTLHWPRYWSIAAVDPLDAGYPVYNSFGPSFTVSFPILPVKRNGTW